LQKETAVIPTLLVPRSTRFLAVLALAGCAASRSPNLESPAPDQAIQILTAARTRGSARVAIALAEPAHVTLFRVVPGEAVGLLRASGDTAMEIAPTLGAGRHELSLVPLGDLDLSGSIAMLSERVGAIVARSAGEASPAFASATSRW
jgi:hypothetical protein